MISHLQTGYGPIATQIQEQGRRKQRMDLAMGPWRMEERMPQLLESFKDIQGLESYTYKLDNHAPLDSSGESQWVLPNVENVSDLAPNIRRNPGVAGMVKHD